ncbi:MAG: hypothetical protein IPL61_31050 [Myxococcales bacterium]|nr:hypothetical protein [Myxococcales bacterium]
MRAQLAAMIVMASTTIAAADGRPTGFLARATPGLGVGVDEGPSCRVHGVTLVGGFWVGRTVAPGLLVGGAVAISLNGAPRDSRCDEVEVGQAFMAAVMGPSVDWYPSARSGLHVVATAGVAEIDHAANDPDPSHGVGGVLALGYDRGAARPKPDGDLRFGLELRLTALRTTGPVRHAALVPSVNASFGFD